MAQQDYSKANTGGNVPNFPKYLFWEFNYNDIEWERSSVMVIERVIERGNNEDWQELFRYYGFDKVVHALKYESAYLMDHTIEKVCEYFNLKPEELRCYIRKQSLPRHWL